MIHVKNRSSKGVDGDVCFVLQHGLFYDGIDEDLAANKKAKRSRLAKKHYTKTSPLRIVQVEVPADALEVYRNWKRDAKTNSLPRSKSRAYRAGKAMANYMIDALLSNHDIYFRIKHNKK